MTVAEISTAIEMPRRTLYRAFSHELAAGRAKRLLASAARLDAMADAGNVSAAKFLHTLIDRDGKPETADDDEWARVAAEISGDAVNLAQNRDFGKPN